MGKRKKRSVTVRPCAKRCKVEEKNLVTNLTDFTLPGFHYLGPGSRKCNGPPTNAIDAIAKKHDDAYSQVVNGFRESHDLKQSVEEIKRADEQFLREMVKTKAATTKEALGKAVGLMGIGIKVAVEKSLGQTLYPAFSKIKHNDDVECNNKILAGDDFN